MEQENVIIYKDISDRQYGCGAYFWSKSLIDLLAYMPFVLVQIIIMYRLFHLSESTSMFLVLGEVTLWHAVLGNSFGILTGNMARGIKAIVYLLPVFFMLFIFLAGLFVNTGSRL